MQVQIYRPVRFYINGEVENPGTHIISGSNYLPLSADDNLSKIENMKKEYSYKNPLVEYDGKFQYKESKPKFNKTLQPLFYPTLIDVIRLSGGVLPYSDLERVQIIRINSQSNGGGKIKAEVNFRYIELTKQRRIMFGYLMVIIYSFPKVLYQFLRI